MIPEGWQSAPIDAVADIVSGGTPSTSVSEYWGGGIPWCTPTDITSAIGKTLTQTERTISEAGLAASAATLLPTGSLLLCTRATVGDVRIASVPIATNQGFKSLIVRSPNHNVFFYYQVSTLRNRLLGLSSGSTFLELSKKDLARIQVLVPPPSEQLAIAEALSDADALIESLDALISKKQDMKQAAMQQLLTRSTRLKGFVKEWVEVQLGDIAALSAAPAKKSGGSRYVIVDMGSVAKDGSLLTHKRTDENEDLLEVGDLVMPKDDIGGGQIIGKAIHIDQPGHFVLGDHVYRLRLSDGHPPYVRYAINSYRVNTSLRSKVVGSAQLGLGRRSVLEQEILFPPLNEQKAIAEVLSDIDAEIEALVAQREKADLVKQGMMQELLSGRVRLA